MTLDAKKKNRIKSFIYLGVFLLGVCAAIIVSVILVKNVNLNNQLNTIKEQLITERDNTQKGEDDDCYTVYVKGDYILEDGEIYIFKK
jgi:hypothetical protein